MSNYTYNDTYNNTYKDKPEDYQLIPLFLSFITASPAALGTVVLYRPSTFPSTPPTMPCWGSYSGHYSQTPYGHSLPTSPGIDGTSGGTNPFMFSSGNRNFFVIKFT